MTELALDCGAVSDTGLVRVHNEDRYWVDAERARSWWWTEWADKLRAIAPQRSRWR